MKNATQIKEIKMPHIVMINRKAEDVVTNNDVVLSVHETMNQAMRASIDAQNTGAAVAAWVHAATATTAFTVKVSLRMRATAEAEEVTDAFEYRILTGLIEAAAIVAEGRAKAAYAPMHSYDISIEVARVDKSGKAADARKINLTK